MGTAAGLHGGGTHHPTIEDIYGFCLGLTQEQATQVAAHARDFIFFTRGLSGEGADALATTLRHAAEVRMLTFVD